MKLKYCTLILVMMAMAFLSRYAAAASSWLVYQSPTGLVYSGYANQGQVSAINTIPDFSKAGYKGGGVAIPFIPAAVTLSDDGPGDDTTRIQNAINTVSAMTVGPDGFRGAVVLEAGDYTVSSPLTVVASGVVIRGAGSQETGGTRITYTATTQSDLFAVADGAGPFEVGGTRTAIADSYVPVGATSFQVADASGFAPGDWIMVQNTVNQQWLDDMSNMSQWGWTVSGYQLTFRRVVTAVDGNRITIDAPIVQAIEDQYGGGDIYKYTYAGELEHIGFECLRLESTYASETDENHGWIAIKMNRLQNGWVRQVTGRYFGYGLVSLVNNSQQITVEDCAMLDPKSVITGGRRYSFNIDDSQHLLIQRCLARHGRHDFVSGSRTPGPNVFVDCRADNTHADSGPHHRYSTGQIYDNIMAGQLNVQNRESSGSGHGWAGAQILFWNCDANSIICDAPNGAMNWCVGSTATQAEGSWAPEEPPGIWDSHNVPVTPRSLYYTQLTERLGTNALNNVILPQQKSGTIWTELHNWDGDGLFLDNLLVRADEQTDPVIGVPLAIRGVVRNLPMLDRGVTSSWSRVYGPAPVTFADDAALETTVTFSQNGTYDLELSVDDGVSAFKNAVTVQVGAGSGDTTPPSAPTNLVATTGDFSISLDWADNSESDLAGYDVYRSTTPGSYGAALAYGLTSSDYEDHSVVEGAHYYYIVRAVDTNVNVSAQSAEVSASLNALPTVDFVEPLDGQIFDEGTSLYVKVNASDNGGSIDYVHLFLNNQFVRQENSAPYEWGAVSQNDPLLQNMAPGMYVLRVVATDDQGASATNSITITVEVDGAAPAAPSGLAATAGDQLVALSWDANTEPDLHDYTIYRSETSGSGYVAITNVTALGYLDSGLINGTTYYYVVTASDTNSNESAQSAEASAMPEALCCVPGMFGSDNSGYAGFTTSTPGSTNEIWSLEPESARYRNQSAGTVNSSLLKAFTLDRSLGAVYSFEGVIHMTDGYADDNNRVGIYLFGDYPEVPNEDEAGAIGIIFNYDDGSQSGPPGNNADDILSIRVGIDHTELTSVQRNQAVPYAQDLFDTDITIRADITFTDLGGTNMIEIVGTLTDIGGSASVTTTVVAAEYTGDYFGFVTRGRARNYIVGGTNNTPENRARPCVMDYKSFYLSLYIPPPWPWPLYIGGPTNDYDGDGLSNLYEYGLDGNPTNAMDQGTLPSFTKTGDTFIYVHPKRSDDPSLIYTVQTTTNLISGAWTNGGYTVTGTNITGGVLDFVTNAVDTVTDEKFIRLKIELP